MTMRALRHALVALALLVGCALAPAWAHAQQLLEGKLPSAPHAPSDAPDVMVHVPSHFDAQTPIHVLVFLHGFSSCARALLASSDTACMQGGRAQRAYGLAALHERAGINSLLIVPQLAFLQRDANAPRFQRAGGFDQLLRELRAGLLADTLGARPIASVTLLAHSAGYRVMAAIVSDAQRQQPIDHLVLFDALYAHWSQLARWYKGAPQRRILSFHTDDAKTTFGNRQLQSELGMVKPLATGKRASQPNDVNVSVQRVATPHGRVPQQHWLEALQWLFGARFPR